MEAALFMMVYLAARVSNSLMVQGLFPMGLLEQPSFFAKLRYKDSAA